MASFLIPENPYKGIAITPDNHFMPRGDEIHA
jgi:hypothetical protein